MKHFDLYGIAAKSMDEARLAVEQALGHRLHEHESAYHGGIYFRYGETGQENFVLQVNYDEYQDELFEPDAEGCQFILYVNHTTRPDELRAMLEHGESVRLIRSEGLPVDVSSEATVNPGSSGDPDTDDG